MPDVQPDVPAREWHLGDDGRVAARNLGQILPPRAHLVASDEPKAVETLTEASGRSDVAIDAGFGEVRRPNAPSGRTHRALAAAYLGGAAHAGWEPHSSVVRRFHAAVLRHLDALSVGGEAVVIGTHGMAMTMWLFARVRPDGDRAGFWATLEFPDVVVVDLERGNYQRSL
jgi:broad specificity phosphatase PhoE